MRRRLTYCALTLGWAFAAALGASVAVAQAPSDSANLTDQDQVATRVQMAIRRDARLEERLGESLPLDATFLDHNGNTVALSTLFDGERPVVLNFAYHTCPVVCSLVLNGTVEALSELAWTAGEEYLFVSISMDPRDTPTSSAETRATLIERYLDGRENTNRAVVETGFVFLSGEEDTIEAVTDAAGFNFAYVENQGEFAHPSAMLIVTPDGKMARYLHGIAFAGNDVRLGLLEAAEGRSLSAIEHAIIFCYRYDASRGGYSVIGMRIMQIGGFLIALWVILALTFFWRQEFRRNGRGAAKPGDVSQSGSSSRVDSVSQSGSSSRADPVPILDEAVVQS